MSENGQRIFAFRKLKVIIIKQKNLTVSVNSGYMFYRNRNKIWQKQIRIVHKHKIAASINRNSWIHIFDGPHI